jgi:hypothetical protein
MSQLVKTKRQANFKDFKRFGAFKGLVEQKNVLFNLFLLSKLLFPHQNYTRILRIIIKMKNIIVISQM